MSAENTTTATTQAAATASAVATTAATSAPAKRAVPAIRSMLESPDFSAQIARALPSHCKPERFVRVAITALTKTPGLLECDKGSFFLQLLRLSELGIEPDGRRAHLIPFRNNKTGTTECQLIIDYKGLAELILRSGLVSCLHADVVCEKDDFLYDRGAVVRHVVDYRNDRGRMYAAYAICRMKDGSEKTECMSRQEVDAIRTRSRSGQSGPWTSDFNEMAKKTVFRRLSKWLPLSAEVRDAVEADDDVIDVTPKAAPANAAGESLVASLESGAGANQPAEELPFTA